MYNGTYKYKHTVKKQSHIQKLEKAYPYILEQYNQNLVKRKKLDKEKSTNMLKHVL